jgi:hypothetical protein
VPILVREREEDVEDGRSERRFGSWLWHIPMRYPLRIHVDIRFGWTIQLHRTR